MDERSAEILAAVSEIRDLLRLLAEPAMAERDRKLRSELRRIVAKSVPGSKAVLLMDGTRTQRAIHRESGINEGNLSTLVKRLAEGKLLSGDGKHPRLTISIPNDFFENGKTDKG
jgi:hypothetical protein